MPTISAHSRMSTCWRVKITSRVLQKNTGPNCFWNLGECEGRGPQKAMFVVWGRLEILCSVLRFK